MDQRNVLVNAQRIHRTSGLSDLTVGVVICAHTMRRWGDLQRAVASVQAQTLAPAEIVVVIDHQPELLSQASAAFGDAVRVIESAGPKGLSGARNTGIEVVSSSVVAFIDDDGEAEPTWIEQLAAVYRDPLVLAVGGRVVPVWPRHRPAWFPEEFDWVVGCSYRGLPERRSEVRNLIGCNMSFRRSVLHQVGEFRTDLGRIGSDAAGCEETEICIRSMHRYPHGRIVHEPRAEVRHHITAERATWRYFVARCRGEGRSKAVISTVVGTNAGLSSERRHMMVTLPMGVLRHLFGRSAGGARVQRAGAIVAGLAIVGWSYVHARVSQRMGGGRRG